MMNASRPTRDHRRAWLQNWRPRGRVVYTVGAGDEPSTMELIEFRHRARLSRVIAAGKGKNNPLDITATPDQYCRGGESGGNMNPRMLVEFIDGSKTRSRWPTSLTPRPVPDVAGSNGPEATLENLHPDLCPKEICGHSSRKGVADYTIGKGVALRRLCRRR